jgi:hypothetical protein
MRLPKLRVLPKDRMHASKRGVVRFIHSLITRTEPTVQMDTISLKDVPIKDIP